MDENAEIHNLKGNDENSNNHRKSIQVKKLDVEELPKGEISYINVEIVTDPLGIPISVPLIAARGLYDGPVLGLTSAVHGNELNGVLVIHEYFKNLDPTEIRGCVIAAPVINIPGYFNNQRKYPDGVDLNRIMPGDKHGDRSQVYAHRIITRIVSQFNYIVDYHTASFGRINSHYIRVNMAHKEAAWMASVQHAQIITHSVAPKFTLRGVCLNMGIHGITVELGSPQRFQRTLVTNSIIGLKNIMIGLGMIDGDVKLPEKLPSVCKKSYWVRSYTGGVLRVDPELADIVEEGEVIATVDDIFGKNIKQIVSPSRGIVIGKNVNPVALSGARIIHLGILDKERQFEDMLKEAVNWDLTEDEDDDDED